MEPGHQPAERVYEPPDAIALEGDGRTARHLREVACIMAASSLPVVIIGEPGAGGEAMAHAIHQHSAVPSGPFSLLACESVSPSVFAYPEPIWETSPLAHFGTTVLKRISELSQTSQSMLVKLLANPSRPCRARLVVCTDRELQDEVQRGRVREDLARNLGQVFVRIPSFRQRREDIPEMAEKLVAKYSMLFDKPQPALGPHLQRALQEASWPGNSFDLEAAAKMIVLIGDERLSIAAIRSAGKEEKGIGGRISLKEAARAASRAAEREAIHKALLRNKGNRKIAARQLEISYKALLYKIKQFGLASTPVRECVK